MSDINDYEDAEDSAGEKMELLRYLPAVHVRRYPGGRTGGNPG